MKLIKRLALAAFLLFLAAADWPQWRGPERNGISPEKNLAKTWPKAGPPLAWTYADAGTGFSSPAVVAARVYVLGARDKVEHVIALQNGKQLWAAKIGPMYDFKGNAWSGGPNAAPVLDADAVYALGSQGIVVCVDRASGKERWHVNLPSQLGGVVNNVGGGPWGFSAAPLLDGDHLIVTPGGPKGLFAALNKNTGAVVWQSRGLTDPTTYGAPLQATIGGVKQYITLVQNGTVSVAAENGDLLWEHRKAMPFPDVVCGTPLVQNDLVFLSVGYGVGSELLKVTANGGKFAVQSVYAVRDLANRQGGVVLVGGYVYGSHELSRWTCLDFMTGAVKWDSPRRGLGVGTVIYADGRLYCVAQDRGQVAMLAASPAAYKEISRFTLPKESTLRKSNAKVWTHPVLSDGMLYVRDQELLFCYKVK